MESAKRLSRNEEIEEFLERGVEKIYPSEEFLQAKLLSGEKISMYLGIDPTAPTLHLGHAIPFLKLAQFQKLGHKAILLIGDFTATIGDPTDKMAARTPLSEKQVAENGRQYQEQVSKIIAFRGKNAARIKYNSAWLQKLPLSETAKLLSHVTYAQTIKRDMFQRRISEGKDLYLNEFLYPVLQGYDSVVLDIDGEVGGSDQTFNMLMGRDLLKRMKNKEKFVVTTKLLTDPAGRKMGKTEDNMVSLHEPAEEMFGKIMSWPDSLIIPAMELCTTLPLSEVRNSKAALESGANPRDLKLRLAEAVVSMCYGEKKATEVRASFIGTFAEGKLPADISEFKAAEGTALSECLMKAGLIKSKTEWRRLVGEGAVSVLSPDGALSKISDAAFQISSTAVFKIGKHRFLKVVV